MDPPPLGRQPEVPGGPLAPGRRLVTLRRLITDLTLSPGFNVFIMSVVTLSCAQIICETSAQVQSKAGWLLPCLDVLFLCAFVAEAVMKIISQGYRYFYSSLNILDFLVMLMSLFHILMTLIIYMETLGHATATAINPVLKVSKALRILQVFRVLRSVRFLSSTHHIISTCVSSLRSLRAIMLLIFMFMIIFAVIFRELFSESDPEHFGSLFDAIFTLFALLTLDDWSTIYTRNKEAGCWYIIIFLIIYIFIEYFIFLDLFIAVLVDNFQCYLRNRIEEQMQKKMAQSKKQDEESTKEPGREDAKIKEDNGVFVSRMMEQNFPEERYSSEQRVLMSTYFQLMAALDYNLHVFRSQAALTDEIVDAFFEHPDDLDLKQSPPIRRRHVP